MLKADFIIAPVQIAQTGYAGPWLANINLIITNT